MAALSVFAVVPSPAVAAYNGSLLGYGGSSTVSLRIQPSAEGAKTALFSATGLPLVCDDDTFPRTDVPTLELARRGRQRYEGEFYQRSADGDQRYYRAIARVKKPGRAVGSVIWFDDPFDPPTGPYAPDCSTAGAPLAWSAKRS